MADTQENLLTEITALATGDFIRAVDDPAGTPESVVISRENFLKTLIDAVSQGSVLYHNGTTWVALPPPSAAGTPLITGGTGANPAWGGALDGNLATLHGYEGNINAQTGTTYTTTDEDCGKVITLDNASAITLTVHQDAPAGFNCLIIQKGAGQVTVAAGGTGNVRNYSGHTKLAGQYAIGTIFVVSNAGTAPEVYLSGITGS